jgi:methylated-DNA-[protein]-cysteine S-methyltransferase
VGGVVPVAVGYISCGALCPGGAAIAASASGVRDIWIFPDPIDAGEARSRFEERLRSQGAIAAGHAGPKAEKILRQALTQLESYCLGKLDEFSCPLDLEGRGAPFEAKVWRALRSIPYGTTRSYGEVARALGRPRAARAVGRACGTNPIPVIIPCHRVVGSSGLGGFGCGLPMKRRLLAVERSRQSTVDS